MEGWVDLSSLLRPGVYLLWQGARVVYVGQSKCPLVRIYTHRSLAHRRNPEWVRSRGIRFDRVYLVPCAADDLNEVERRLIQHYQPIYNVKHKTGGIVEALVGMVKPEIVITRRL